MTKIISRIEFQMTDSGMEEVFRDDHWHEGPIEHCGGGPSPEQKAAAAANARTTDKLGQVADRQQAFTEAQQAKVNPFYTDEMNNGPDYTNQALDFAGGTNAQAFAPEKANLVRRLGASTWLPSGSREQSLTDFEERRALGYDNSLMAIRADRQAARERGAAGLMGQAQQANPLGYYQGAVQGNASILNANLRKPGIAGTIGGLVGGTAGAFA
jgi:hypothetical protein